jgi:hypothetical protein
LGNCGKSVARRPLGEKQMSREKRLGCVAGAASERTETIIVPDIQWLQNGVKKSWEPQAFFEITSMEQVP